MIASVDWQNRLHCCISQVSPLTRPGIEVVTWKIWLNGMLQFPHTFPMLNTVEAELRPLVFNTKVLDIAYELYLQAPQEIYPVINLKELAQRTGVSLLECRNSIVEANRLGQFPNCTLHS